MQISKLIHVCDAKCIGSDVEFERISTDTRQLQAGDLYVALVGTHFDGHTFLSDAQQLGASGCIVQRYHPDIKLTQLIVKDTTQALGALGAYWRAQFTGKVVALTGSSGKTSVKGMLREIFAAAESVLATEGNLNNHIGVPLTLMKLNHQAYAVLEMGTNHPGEIDYLAELVKPDVALVNNIMPAHIGGFGSLNSIAEEKAAIYKRLEPHQSAIINLDDPFADYFMSLTGGCHRMGFSLQAQSAKIPVVVPQAIGWDQQGCAHFDLCFIQQRQPVELQVPGLHNVSNALAAAACALAAGCALTIVAQGLQAYTGDKGRMQFKRGLNDAKVIDDTYNANPGSVKAAIDYLNQCSGERILVLGDMAELGEFGPEAHRDLGRYALQKNIQQVYTLGNLARLSAQMFGPGAEAFDDKPSLIRALQHRLAPTSTILIKGSRSARMEDITQALCFSGDHH